MLLWALGSSLQPTSAEARQGIPIMPTTSQLLGLTPQEKAAAIFTAAGEAGPGKDALGVFQTLLTRRAMSGQNLANLAKAPQQFVANDPYNLKQVTDPAYGVKVHGSRYQQLEKMFEDPSQVAEGLRIGQGATQFRGQSLLKVKRKEDVMFDPKGNFYFQQNPNVAQGLIKKLGQTGESQTAAAPGRTFIIYGDQGDEADAGMQFLGDFMMKNPAIQTTIDPAAALAQAFQLGGSQV